MPDARNLIGDIQRLSISLFGNIYLNWVDFIIVVFTLLYAVEGYALGFLYSSVDFLNFVISFLIALKFYYLPARFINETFGISQGFSNAIGFFVAAFIAEIILSAFLKKILKDFISPLASSIALFKKANNILGIIPGMLSSLVLLAFTLTLIVALPVSPAIKNAVSNSSFGGVLVSYSQVLEKDLNKVFGGAVSDTLNFLTISPRSNESVDLKFTVADFSVDQEAEAEMLVLVNGERASEGLPSLTGSVPLRGVARAHCEDMFRRGYFSHYTPEGLSPFDRMDNAGIQYEYAGENLALAPTTKTAMQGLMNSPGHRANILSSDFGTVGIGVIDGGVYGKMFCQEFTN